MHRRAKDVGFALGIAALDRLGQLINDILDFEKASSGKMRFDMRVVAVDDLIDRCINASRFYAEQSA